ncbi:MAG: hypothetical protein ACFB0C_15630 [Leptolyngbyaceae cyanobacterium]
MAFYLDSDGQGLEVTAAGAWSQQASLCIVARVKVNPSPAGQNRIFMHNSGGARVIFHSAPGTPFRVITSRDGQSNMTVTFGAEAEHQNGEYHTVAVRRAATPDGDHYAGIDGVEQGITTNIVTSGVFSENTSTNFLVGKDQSNNAKWLDGGLEYLWVWNGANAPDECVKALSNGLHPNLAGLGMPALALEFPGANRALVGSISSSNVAGYETGAGSYKLLPSSALVYSLQSNPASVATLVGIPPVFVATGLAIAECPATLSGSVEGLTANISAGIGYPASLAGVAPNLAGSGQAVTDAPAVLVAAVDGLAGNATAAVGYTASLTGATPNLVGSGQAVADAPAALTATVEGLTGSATAILGYTATLSGTEPDLSLNGQALTDAPAILAATVEGLTGSAIATVAGAVNATLTGSPPNFAATGQAAIDAPATLSGTLEGLTGSGIATLAGAVDASLNGIPPVFVASAEAVVDAPATVVGIVPNPVASGVATVHVSASLVANLQGLTANGAMMIPELVTALTAVDPRRATLGQLNFIDRPTVQGMALVEDPSIT